jgi:hypothetical protein
MADELGTPRARGGPTLPGVAESTWLDAVDDLLDATIEADEAVECRFDDLAVDVPLRMGVDAPRARWRLDGTVRVSVEGTRGPLAAWLRWWATRADG